MWAKKLKLPHNHLTWTVPLCRLLALVLADDLNDRDLARQAPGNLQGPSYLCHDPAPEIYGPAPSVQDCNDVIEQFAALTTDINVQLVAGCYQIASGNCTGLVCPQREGSSTIPGLVAAQYMQTPLLDECISKGSRGWWIDGRNWGVGVYLV